MALHLGLRLLDQSIRLLELTIPCEQEGQGTPKGPRGGRQVGVTELDRTGERLFGLFPSFEKEEGVSQIPQDDPLVAFIADVPVDPPGQVVVGDGLVEFSAGLVAGAQVAQGDALLALVTDLSVDLEGEPEVFDRLVCLSPGLAGTSQVAQDSSFSSLVAHLPVQGQSLLGYRQGVVQVAMGQECTGKTPQHTRLAAPVSQLTVDGEGSPVSLDGLWGPALFHGDVTEGSQCGAFTTSIPVSPIEFQGGFLALSGLIEVRLFPFEGAQLEEAIRLDQRQFGVLAFSPIERRFGFGPCLFVLGLFSRESSLLHLLVCSRDRQFPLSRSVLLVRCGGGFRRSSRGVISSCSSLEPGLQLVGQVPGMGLASAGFL